MFEDDEILEVRYAASLKRKTILKIKKPLPKVLEEKPVGKVLDEYSFEIDFVPATIQIIQEKGNSRPLYYIDAPTTGPYTKNFLEHIMMEVTEAVPIEIKEIFDPKQSKTLKETFFKQVKQALKKYLPNVEEKIINQISGSILHRVYGLGELELLMSDDMLEEIAINSAKTPVTIYHKERGWLKTNIILKDEDEVINYSSQIARRIGREITTLKPILDAHLTTGDRVNATMTPISSEGNTITIRKFARRPWTLTDFVGKTHTLNSEMAALLWLAMQYEMNILIAGGTASGKTSTLNTLLATVPPYHRVLSIEDVREIMLPDYLKWNWVPLVTRAPNPEGLGEISMLDLMVSSLRMRPDRIIVGEIRRKKEAEVMMEAIETGHSIYSTLHANSAYQVLRRLSESPMSIPPMQIELIDLVLVQYRDRKTNKRRTYELAEIEQSSTGKALQANIIYKWNPRTDEWDKIGKPTKILTLLNLHTGLTEEETLEELDVRKQILEWMVRQNINEIDSVGEVMRVFYTNLEKLKELVKEDAPFEKLKEID